MAGLGVIIRDHFGRVLLSAARPKSCVSDVDMVESLAVQEGIFLALDAGLAPLHLETDSLRVFQLLSSDREDESEVGVFISSLKSSLSDKDISISFSFVNR